MAERFTSVDILNAAADGLTTVSTPEGWPQNYVVSLNLQNRGPNYSTLYVTLTTGQRFRVWAREVGVPRREK